MFVIKRNNLKEKFQFDKITNRLQKLIEENPKIIDIDPILITQKLAVQVYSGISTTELDNLASIICMNQIDVNPSYANLASRIVVSNHHKNTLTDFKEVIEILYKNTDINNNNAPLVSEKLYKFVLKNSDKIQKLFNFERDYLIDFFGFKTLERAYLLKSNKKIIERPQHMFMRVAIGIHENNFKKIVSTYNSLSKKEYIHATPTLFHAGTQRPQMSSCFLLGTEDSIDGIYKTITDCAKISKWAGGIGLSISNIRSSGSYIRKTGGYSDGIIPMLKVYNATARYVNQSGKRNGSFAMYIEPWHSDIFKFLEARKNHGNEEERARDLFYALWIPDLFMERVKNNLEWSLMCPDQCPGLTDVYGDDFKNLYEKYEKLKKYKKVIKARDLWKSITTSQVETGVPYMSYKNAANKKSNQKNIGIIKSSNLCNEIYQFSNTKETAVCNLASISLSSILLYPLSYTQMLQLDTNNSFLEIYSKPNCGYCKVLYGILDKHKIKYNNIDKEVANNYFFKLGIKNPNTVPVVFVIRNGHLFQYLGNFNDIWNRLKPRIDWASLKRIAYDLVINLNKVIDLNFYPTKESKNSNMLHRPIGIGIQGLADLFAKLKLPFTSSEAKKINKFILETIYFGAMEASCNLSIKYGPYSTFKGSPLSKGQFQFDLWNLKSENLCGFWDWDDMRQRVIKNGVRNSLLIALMPTASTSQILGNNECFEPFTSNIYKRRTLAGVFTVINNYLIQDLKDIKLWNEDIKNKILYNRGSIQNIKEIPKFLKNIYKTVWEISQKELIQMSADRAPFVCNSQSLNLWFDNPNLKLLTNAHFFGWSLGLKTGSYYVRSKPAINMQKFGLDISVENKIKEDIEDEKICDMCSG